MGSEMTVAVSTLFALCRLQLQLLPNQAGLFCRAYQSTKSPPAYFRSYSVVTKVGFPGTPCHVSCQELTQQQEAPIYK